MSAVTAATGRVHPCRCAAVARGAVAIDRRTRRCARAGAARPRSAYPVAGWSPACCGQRAAAMARGLRRTHRGRPADDRPAGVHRHRCDACHAGDRCACPPPAPRNFSGQDWHFTARLTAAGADGAAGLNVTLDGQGKANGLGPASPASWPPDGTLAGTISSRGPNLAVLLPAPPVPFRADGRLTVSSGLGGADDLALEIGGSPASGAVALARRAAAAAGYRVVGQSARSGCVAAGAVARRHDHCRDQSSDRHRSLRRGGAFGGGTLQHLRAAFDLTATS